jgi:hypothetical protein
MGEKRWTEMTADEQVPPWRWLVDEQLLRDDLNAWNKAAENDDDTHEQDAR